MNTKDLKVEFYKSGGPGGQHKNKRFMAVRITHKPTGLVAVGQEYRSQKTNKEVALERLREKLRAKFQIKKARIPTRESRAVKARTLEWKKRHGVKKKLRQEKIRVDNE
jgi:peptide chain release factor 1